MRALPTLSLSVFAVALLVAEERPSSVAEQFVLSPDRGRVVANLPPGSVDRYYYQCLLWQGEGKLAERPRRRRLAPT